MKAKKAKGHMSYRVKFTRDDGGFTTLGAAVALLLVLALLVVSLRALAVGTRSANVQYVADAGALAADTAVAEFVTVGQVVDAALLSLSLLGLTVYVASAIAAFIPGAQSVATKLAKTGTKVFRVRKKFAKGAKKTLNKVQKALPAICALRAAECIQANARLSSVDERLGNVDYAGFAIASPIKGVNVKISDDSDLENACDDIKDEEKDIEERSARHDQSREDMDELKQYAWLNDCGSDGECMRERASSLAGLSGAQNPTCSSVENWSFSMALSRAKSYYRARLSAEPGQNYQGQTSEIVKSIARKRFYRYAIKKVSQGSVKTKDGVEYPTFELLPYLLSDVRETEMYTESAWPVSVEDGVRTLHAWEGCSACVREEKDGYASLKDIDSGDVQMCSVCKFNATKIWRASGISTSGYHGFEKYYKRVAEAANKYRSTAEQTQELQSELNESRNTVGDLIKNALKSLKNVRYDPQPPGRYGCICIVCAPASQVASIAGFAQGARKVKARVAISGATLAPQASNEQGSVISEIADGLVPSTGIGHGLARMVLGTWGSMLGAYTGGIEGIKAGLKKMLGWLPAGNELSSSALTCFTGAIDEAGLAPAKLQSYKPVLVNTAHIAEKGGGALKALKIARSLAEGTSAWQVGDIKSLLNLAGASSSVQQLFTDEGLIVATIPLSKLGFGLEDKNITLKVPNNLKQRLSEAIADSFEALEAA